MATMDEMLNDDVLNSIGKILVIKSHHGLTQKRIKELTEATKIKKLKNNSDSDVENFLSGLMLRALHIMEIDEWYGHDIYMVTGIDAKSTLIRLMANVYASISLDAKAVKNLHNASLTHEQLLRAKRSLQNAMQNNETASENLKQLGRKSDIEKRGKKLAEVVNGYGESELRHEKSIVEGIMKLDW